MSTAAFTSIMLIVVFAFIAAMIWAYRRHDYKEEKRTFNPEILNCLDDTMKTVTSYSEDYLKDLQHKEEVEKKKLEEEERQKDPLAKIDALTSRAKMIQAKNHIKKSAADEYFEKTRMVANEILKPKT